MTILEAMDDPRLFGPWFTGRTWRAWRVFLAALFALTMDAEALAVYRAQTGRTSPPTKAFREAALIVGRRGGKSRIAALIAVFLACFRDFKRYLAPGEVGTIAIVAADRRQAKVILWYVQAFLREIPALASLVESTTAESVTLRNGIVIEVTTASFRTIRGRTLVALLADEIAQWRDEESANPDVEIIGAARPGMVTIPEALLLMLSSPYARRGVLYETSARYFGKDGSDVLVWNADTRTMNPAVDSALIERAFVDDPSAAAAEYGRDGHVSFRSDLETLLSLETIGRVVVAGRHEVPPALDLVYEAFVDPSGGSSDSMTLGIGHRLPSPEGEPGRAALDVVAERQAPFDPESVVRDFAELLKAYRVSAVVGDRYAGEWVRSSFERHGISYRISELSKSEIYREALPLFNGQRIELLDNPRLTAQLASLERRVARGGSESIDHPPGGHDDVANAACGVLVGLSGWHRHAGVIEFYRQQYEELRKTRSDLPAVPA